MRKEADDSYSVDNSRLAVMVSHAEPHYEQIKAKVDPWAETSLLHASLIELFR